MMRHVLHHRSAFSLVELMIGTIILGLGLLMIGAVLPIAWRGSIQTSDQTRADGAADAAKYAVQINLLLDGARHPDDGEPNLFARVDPDSNDPVFYNPLFRREPRTDPNRSDLGDSISYSLLGDFDTPDLVDLGVDGNVDPEDTRATVVHALHLENVAADLNSDFIVTAGDPLVPEAPILIDRVMIERSILGLLPTYRVGTPAVLNPNTNAIGADDPLIFTGRPAIGFRERVFPPISTSIVTGSEQWNQELAERRFTWAVFHKLLRVPTTPFEPRSFMMYYVTLRRGERGNRYARQAGRALPGAIEALGSADDVLFPIAWRVPLEVIANDTGVPSIAFAGADLPNVPPVNVPDLFPAGAWFIDELTGLVYRVNDREFLSANSTYARLTLDRSVSTADLASPAVLQPESRNVWIFPPPVVASIRDEGDDVAFTGFNPVVDIRVEPLSLVP